MHSAARSPQSPDPILDEETLSRFASEEPRRIYEFLGATPITHGGVAGTRFSVWAPGAQSVTLRSDACHPMRRRTAGVWEVFVAGIGPGARYEYEIHTGAPERVLHKTDPVGFAMSLRPDTQAVVWDLSRYAWKDEAWMEGRGERQKPGAPISVYEAHLGSWRRRAGTSPGDPAGWLTYRELADELLTYVKRMGFTHLELLPITEHPLDASWGYQTVGYFAPTSRFGSPDDFRYFVDLAHDLEIGVILDWAPAHFPRDEHGLALFDGTHLYEHPDPRRGAHPDWGTSIYDYGKREVRAFLISSALFWLDQYHVDGLRVDAVASMLYLDYSRAPGDWVPNIFGGRGNLEAISFLHTLNDTLHEEHPDALIFAEESTAWPKVSHPTSEGGLGFDMKWKLGWMNDTLRVMQAKPSERGELHDVFSLSISYAFSERCLLPLSHDEVVHLKKSLLLKMPGSEEEKLANLRLLYGYMWAHPGVKLLFMGGEFGQKNEWNHDAELEWELLTRPDHRGVQELVRTLNRLYVHEPALHELALVPEGFEWIDSTDARRSVISFLRRARDIGDFVAVVANFSDHAWPDYRLGVPREGTYRLLLNTDAAEFGGRSRGGVAKEMIFRTTRVAATATESPATITEPPTATAEASATTTEPPAATAEAPSESVEPTVNSPYALELSLPPLTVLYLKRDAD